MTPLSDLIARLEAAKEGGRELDNLVAPIAGWKRITPSVAKRAGLSCRSNGGWIAPEDIRNGKVLLDSLHGTTIYRDPPQFTRSLDAALMLARDNHELLKMLHAAYFACSGGDGKVDIWPLIQAALTEVLKAREAGR